MRVVRGRGVVGMHAGEMGARRALMREERKKERKRGGEEGSLLWIKMTGNLESDIRM